MGIIWIVLYVAAGVFNFWSLLRNDIQNKKRITRGDVVFISVFALIGPFGLGASISALAGHRFKEWADTEVLKKDIGEG